MSTTTHSPHAMTDLARLDAPTALDGAKTPPDAESCGPAVALRVEDVYREQFRFAWRSLRHLGVAEADVEDAAQDVFVVIHAKLATFEHRAKITTWIYGICMNVANARRRRAHVRRELPTDPAMLPVDDVRGEQADEALERRQAEEMLDRILDTLPIEQRAVFTLFELDGRTSEEIAGLCAIPLGTVYSRLRLAREAWKRATARLEARERFLGGAS
jgi:RNA polymerase sigma-70 factor (ECF subfamily)